MARQLIRSRRYRITAPPPAGRARRRWLEALIVAGWSAGVFILAAAGGGLFFGH
jgi:hypothetical protein